MMARDRFNPKVGDRVRIRQWDDMAFEFGLDYDGDVPIHEAYFSRWMKSLCGAEFTVEKILDNEILGLPDSNWYITADMLEPVDDEAEEVCES